MYKYREFDKDFVQKRISQFEGQIKRRISGALTEDEFKPLRLMNGVYLQLHAYMLRVAIPYGTLNSAQLRQLAFISEHWDRGYGHFTTRQNIQFNWPQLTDIPKILAALAEVEMHAIQTSGNCIRNVTADHFSGASADEIEDPRPVAELLRQWSTDHPEFQFLPRKFKIAISGSNIDRAVIRAHDIGIETIDNNGKIGYRIFVGGGLGRTPMQGRIIKDFLPKRDLLPYFEAIIHVWNRIGRRDNKYKSRIKILVHEYGLENLQKDVEEAFTYMRTNYDGRDQLWLEEICKDFTPPIYHDLSLHQYDKAVNDNSLFRAFIDSNTHAHKNKDYAILTISTKAHGAIPGDMCADQMRVVADLAQKFGHDDIRVSHEQNLILPHVHKAHLPQIYQALRNAHLHTANIGKISDIIACPGLDYCALATARSIPIAQEIARYFQSREDEIGKIQVKISGCINACGHHHVGHIGILGLDKAGIENYQITLGGNAGADFSIGTRIGPGFSAEELLPALERLIEFYLNIREADELFINCLQRVGLEPFKNALYPKEESYAAE